VNDGTAFQLQVSTVQTEFHPVIEHGIAAVVSRLFCAAQ
jgi:hypothetical protein